MKVFVDDGCTFVRVKGDEVYDVIIVDSTDFDRGASVLYGYPFMDDIQRLLKVGGVFVRNVDSPMVSMQHLVKVQTQALKYFKHSYYYTATVPSYVTGTYAFLFMSNDVHPGQNVWK